MKPPTLGLAGGGAGFSCISRQNNLTVFLFFFNVADFSVGESVIDVEEVEGKCLGKLKKLLEGIGGGIPGNIPGGGGGSVGGGGGREQAPADSVSSSESYRKSEKSKSHKWKSRFLQLFFNSSQ